MITAHLNHVYIHARARWGPGGGVFVPSFVENEKNKIGRWKFGRSPLLSTPLSSPIFFSFRGFFWKEGKKRGHRGPGPGTQTQTQKIEREREREREIDREETHVVDLVRDVVACWLVRFGTDRGWDICTYITGHMYCSCTYLANRAESERKLDRYLYSSILMSVFSGPCTEYGYYGGVLNTQAPVPTAMFGEGGRLFKQSIS